MHDKVIINLELTCMYVFEKKVVAAQKLTIVRFWKMGAPFLLKIFSVLFVLVKVTK